MIASLKNNLYHFPEALYNDSEFRDKSIKMLNQYVSCNPLVKAALKNYNTLHATFALPATIKSLVTDNLSTSKLLSKVSTAFAQFIEMILGGEYLNLYSLNSSVNKVVAFASRLPLFSSAGITASADGVGKRLSLIKNYFVAFGTSFSLVDSLWSKGIFNKNENDDAYRTRMIRVAADVSKLAVVGLVILSSTSYAKQAEELLKQGFGNMTLDKLINRLSYISTATAAYKALNDYVSKPNKI